MLETFTVNVRLNYIISYDISASSLENAVEQAKVTLKNPNFLAKNIECLDGHEEIIGVNSDWNLE